MKKLYFCDQCNKILPKGEIICDRCGFENTQIIPELSEDLLRDERRRKKLRKLCIVGVLILLFVADNFIFPPAWWRFERQADKNAIVNYVSKYYPKNIRRVGFSFPLQMPFAPHAVSTMDFELDGTVFYVSAENGRVISDSYLDEKMNEQFNKIIKEDFLKPRGIDAGVGYYFADAPAYPYKGSMELTLYVYAVTPQEAGWLYDFFEYWKQEADFLENYTVSIRVGKKTDDGFRTDFYFKYDKGVLIADENSFYSSFFWRGLQ